MVKDQSAVYKIKQSDCSYETYKDICNLISSPDKYYKIVTKRLQRNQLINKKYGGNGSNIPAVKKVYWLIEDYGLITTTKIILREINKKRKRINLRNTLLSFYHNTRKLRELIIQQGLSYAMRCLVRWIKTKCGIKPFQPKDCIYQHLRILLKKTFHIKSKRTLTINNTHVGERCFIVCTGPSLTVEDCNKLKQEYTISMNSIYKLFDKTDWRPDCYVCFDYVVAE